MKTRTKELRKSKNMSQTALGMAIGYAQNTISKIECEREVPNADILYKLADYFHTSIDYLLYRTDQRYTTDIVPSSNPRLTQYMLKLQELASDEQDSIFYFIDVILNAKSKR